MVGDSRCQSILLDYHVYDFILIYSQITELLYKLKLKMSEKIFKAHKTSLILFNPLWMGRTLVSPVVSGLVAIGH